MAGNPHEPVLDRDVIESLRALDPPGPGALLERLIEIYRRDCRRLLAELRDASVPADPARLRAAAHDLKSASANLGLRRLSRRAAELEQAARSKQRLAARARVEAIAAELECALQALAQIAARD